MSVHRLQDDEKGVTAHFEMYSQLNEAKSKKAGRPIADDIELCRIQIAGYTKEKQPVFPAHEVSHYTKRMTQWGTEEKVEVTYAERFNKQYLEFKNGGPQTASGTPLAELPFLTESKRREYRAVGVYTAEALSALDGQALKQLGPGGREHKDQATAYIANAAKGATSGQLADELAKRDAEIAALKLRIDSMAPDAAVPEAKPVSAKMADTFATFEDEDIVAWLTDAGVTVDKRWSRSTMIAKAEEILAKTGKVKQAA